MTIWSLSDLQQKHFQVENHNNSKSASGSLESISDKIRGVEILNSENRDYNRPVHIEMLKLWVRLSTGYRKNLRNWVPLGTRYRANSKSWVPLGTGYRPVKNFWDPMGIGYRENFHLFIDYSRKISDPLDVAKNRDPWI